MSNILFPDSEIVIRFSRLNLSKMDMKTFNFNFKNLFIFGFKNSNPVLKCYDYIFYKNSKRCKDI